MFSTWNQKYIATNGKTSLAGWCFDAEADCEAYFVNRVTKKLQDSDTTALLQEYLVEMADTGFDTTMLQAQVQSPPRAKDWEIGEAFAQVMLEDRFDASFPWPTSWDKRTPKASLPGPDMPGFHRKNGARFLFGEVKSSSENKTPPQVVNCGDDCLCKQMGRLLTSSAHRQQLIEWLLVRTKDSKTWKPVFEEAMKCYANGDACICGVLVRGGIEPNQDDLLSLQAELAAAATGFDVHVYAFHLPFDKSRWVELIYGKELLQ